MRGVTHRRMMLGLAAWACGSVALAVTNLPIRLTDYTAAAVAVRVAVATPDYTGYATRLEALGATTFALNEGLDWLANRCRAGLATEPFADRQESVFAALALAGDARQARELALMEAQLLRVNHHTNHEALVALALVQLTNAPALSARAVDALQSEHERLSGTPVPATLTMELGGPAAAAPGELIELVARVANVGDQDAGTLSYRLEPAMGQSGPPPSPASAGTLTAGGTLEVSIFVRVPITGTVASYSFTVWGETAPALCLTHDLKLEAPP